MANPADIVDIIQVPALIKDEFIKKGSVVLDERGNPIHYTGGFAIVFPFVINGDKWAFRCWYNSIGNVGKRLKVLSEELNKLRLPYFCNFSYIEKGIVIDGVISPTTRMQWIEGENIKDYICRNVKNKQSLINLAENFYTMCHDLHNAKIAHGDLQHGNILVDSSGKIFLIDYDSVYLPALHGEKDIITGLPAYQHPARVRRENVYAHEKLDYFSELVIYISILAIIESPDLIKQFKIDQSDNLLFVRKDYENLKISHIYKTLISLKNDKITQLLDILDDYLQTKDIRDLKPFENYIFNNVKSSHSLYCIMCGKKFEYDDDVYCINCGTKRI